MLPKARESWTVREAAHLLNRAGFGGSPEEIRAWHALGRRQAVEKLISPDVSDEEPAPPPWSEPEQVRADMIARRESLQEMRRNIRDATPEAADRARREANQQLQREFRRRTLEAQNWWFRRMVLTKAPLHEKMTLFWHDHFATSVQKVRDPAMMVIQNRLFRDHATGNFKRLTAAVASDPAMMVYLDMRNSRRGRPNENFARELMELFTLGEGQYTEDDVREAARAFTGYQMDRMSGRVSHNRRQWDNGVKTIFGKEGRFTGSDVIDLIFEQPATARFIAGKIWDFFVYENPSGRGVDTLAGIFRDTGYDMAVLLREIFLSREFYSEQAVRTQIKSPIQYLVSILKELEIDQPPAGFAIAGQQQLGQVLFMPPNVAGWDWGKAWINTNTLLARYNLAGFLTQGADNGGPGMGVERAIMQGMGAGRRRGGTGWKGPDYERIAPRPLREDPIALVEELTLRFFHEPVPERARDSFVQYAEAKKGVIFTNREVAELCHLMLSTPYYQLC